MTLFKQLLLFISALFLIIFCVNFILSVNNSRSYLEGEATVHAQDTATSLGLSLSPYMVNEKDPIIETTMKVIFDSGYFWKIRLVDVDDNPLVYLVNKEKIEGVPSWFIKLFPIKVATANSEINSGWNISGNISVSANSGYAYQKLYTQAKSSLFYSLAFLALSLGLLYLLLQIILLPLQRVEQMALNIANGKFNTIESLPKTIEIRNVTASMNMMSHKIEDVIKRLNDKVVRVGERLQKDELTGLKNKTSFDTDIKLLFASDISAYLYLIKIDGLSDLVKELDDDSIDALLIYFSKQLKKIADQDKKQSIVSVYRFRGSEFMLLARDIEFEQAEQLAKQIRSLITRVGEKHKKSDIAHIGIVPFSILNTEEGLLLAANEAYEQARIIAENGYYFRMLKDQARDNSEWKKLVFNVIENHNYNVTFVGKINSFQTGKLIMEEAFTQIFDTKGNLVSTATFVSIAEKYARIIELDKGVVLKVIGYINTTKASHAVAINLSTRTIKNSSFLSWLTEIINQNRSISEQLVFSFSAYAVAKDYFVFIDFIDFVNQLNAKIMIKRFEIESLSPEKTKVLRPDFIRLTREASNGISSNPEKKIYVETMKELGEVLDIAILAEDAHLDSDYHCLDMIGIKGASS